MYIDIEMALTVCPACFPSKSSIEQLLTFKALPCSPEAGLRNCKILALYWYVTSTGSTGLSMVIGSTDASFSFGFSLSKSLTTTFFGSSFFFSTACFLTGLSLTEAVSSSSIFTSSIKTMSSSSSSGSSGS